MLCRILEEKRANKQTKGQKKNQPKSQRNMEMCYFFKNWNFTLNRVKTALRT